MVGKDNIAIWQQNINKSPACQHDLISNNALVRMGIDIIALQEPAINAFNQTIASKDWTPVYPTPHGEAPDRTRAITLVRTSISTDSWNQLDFPSSDVTVIQLNGDWGKLTLLNIYNDGKHNEMISKLSKFQQENQGTSQRTDKGGSHTIWVGDFNRHHPHWDDLNDTRLFTTEAIRAAEVLIESVAESGLTMALPSGTPTHCHNVTKHWSRLDQVFISEHSENIILTCNTQTEHRGINMNHLPIITELDLSLGEIVETASPNFREVDWEEFNKDLEGRLNKLQPASKITMQRQLDSSCADLTKAIQESIRVHVLISKILPRSKRWWTKELMQLRKLAGKMGRQAYKLKDSPEHSIHEEHKRIAKKYESMLERTKKQHWRDWLENAEDPDIWVANKIISTPASDRGKARIPTLKYKVDDREVIARTNGEKSLALAKCFFPPKPQEPNTQQEDNHAKQHKVRCKITHEQIQKQLRKLQPYKAPGPDGIPNVVLTKCESLLTNRLFHIYNAMYERNLLYKPWKQFTMVVLRKPGKLRYDTPKAHRPIALLNTMWKVLTALIAGQLTHIMEKLQLRPSNHFGGRPGHTTTDTLHLLTHKIKTSWRAGKVTSVLFLDIEGAFPNAVPSKLVYNLRK